LSDFEKECTQYVHFAIDGTTQHKNLINKGDNFLSARLKNVRRACRCRTVCYFRCM